MDNNFIFLITFFSPLFIFNFTSLFILAQENFHKFNSIKLLRMVISPLIILFCIIIPAGIILLAFANVLPKPEEKLYSACGIIYGIATSIYLLRRLKKMLDPIYAAKKIISEIKDDEFYFYKNAEIPKGQSNFDDLLRLCCGVIERNDEFESAVVFEFVFDWLCQHNDKVKPNTEVYWEQQNDKFNVFFLRICEKLNQKDNSIIKDNYVKAIYKSFLVNIDCRDFDKILFQLNSLKKLSDVLLERGLYQDNLVANNIYHSIIDPSINILNKIQPSSYEEIGFIEESENYKKFEATILDSIKNMYKTAIKCENTDFINHKFIACRLFNSYENNAGRKFITWNSNYLQCYFDISPIYKDVVKVKNYDKKCVQFVLWEYRHLLDAMKYQDANRTVVKHLFNASMRNLTSIFIDLIENTNVLKADDFVLYYDVFLYKNLPADYQVKSYLCKFSFLLEKIFARPKENGCMYDYTACELWGRTEQILKKLTDLKDSHTSFWKECCDKLQNQFPNSYNDYQKYIETVNGEIKQFKKAMSEEVFKP